MFGLGGSYRRATLGVVKFCATKHQSTNAHNRDAASEAVRAISLKISMQQGYIITQPQQQATSVRVLKQLPVLFMSIPKPGK
eukprot:2306540-Amphidinium_carterae.1